MSTSADRGFLDALAALSRALDETGASAMIIGGVAVIAHGVPRLTVDIDATVDASGVALDQLAVTLGRHDIEPRTEDAAAFARYPRAAAAEGRTRGVSAPAAAQASSVSAGTESCTCATTATMVKSGDR